ncbi:MAG: right-handed parallel beta-helix repeat-containing protein [Symploca sp. SIO1A3]|nr:right-handed parallel beta-helix repeat-containing protein [Symploca sp. SIO1A3]
MCWANSKWLIVKLSIFNGQFSIFQQLTLALLSILALPAVAAAEPSSRIEPLTNVDIVVNSNADTLASDEVLTLREAIAIVNGTLPLQQLSEAERRQVRVRKGSLPETSSFLGGSSIEFDLPPQQTTIELTKPLSILASPGLLIDGTSQAGYGDSELEADKLTIPAPVVAITPAAGTEIWQGLTVVADGVTIRGLSIYGFNTDTIPDALIPPADIFISHPPSPKELSERNVEELSPYDSLMLTEDLLFDSLDMPPPEAVVIEDNWLGIAPTKETESSNPQSPIPNPQFPIPNSQSAFGVYSYNSSNVKITGNAIANHQGSGIITSRQATNLLIENNLLEGNGFAGMPDAIRLEGDISGSTIIGNLIRQNAGSGIFTFKPDGAVEIRDNTITNNGHRLEQAAVYLMGNEHQVINNQISNQPGSGVTVAAVPESRRITITGNQFANLQGLGIDLVTQQGSTVQAYQVGDGRNPLIDNYQRRRQTANLAVNTPRFFSQEFFFLSSTKVTLLGEALPGSTVEIYRVTDSISNSSSDEEPGKQWEPITSISVDEEGEFSITLTEVQPGEQVSAIATHPDYGTSEPAVNAVIRSLPTAAFPSLENF